MDVPAARRFFGGQKDGVDARAVQAAAGRAKHRSGEPTLAPRLSVFVDLSTFASLVRSVGGLRNRRNHPTPACSRSSQSGLQQ